MSTMRSVDQDQQIPPISGGGVSGGVLIGFIVVLASAALICASCALVLVSLFK
jgi:hypothetical protein